MKNIGQMLCMCSFFGVVTYVSKASEPQSLECMLRLQATQSDCRTEITKKIVGTRALRWIRGRDLIEVFDGLIVSLKIDL